MRIRISVLSLLLLTLFLFTSCEKLDEGEYKTYHISKGKHYANGSVEFMQKCSSRIEFVIAISNSMFYDPLKPGFKNGHNKLMGIVAMSETNIRSYSARISWRCKRIDKMDIGFIIHLPSQEDPILGILLNDVAEGDLIYCTVSDMNKQGFYVSAKNARTGEFFEKTIDKKGAGNVKYHKLINYPYFGGDETAPHDIDITMCANKI